MKKTKSLMFTFFGIQSKISTKIETWVIPLCVALFCRKNEWFYKYKSFFLACRKYIVKNPKINIIMDTKVFHSNLQMPDDGWELIMVAYAS